MRLPTLLCHTSPLRFLTLLKSLRFLGCDYVARPTKALLLCTPFFYHYSPSLSHGQTSFTLLPTLRHSSHFQRFSVTLPLPLSLARFMSRWVTQFPYGSRRKIISHGAFPCAKQTAIHHWIATTKRSGPPHASRRKPTFQRTASLNPGSTRVSSTTRLDAKSWRTAQGHNGSPLVCADCT